MSNKLIIVDQSTIPASFECESLFLNGVHILDADEQNDLPIHEIAQSLANALEIEVEGIGITEKELAQYLAKKYGKEAEFKEIAEDNDDFDDWVQGYSNDDIINALKLKG